MKLFNLRNKINNDGSGLPYPNPRPTNLLTVDEEYLDLIKHYQQGIEKSLLPSFITQSYDDEQDYEFIRLDIYPFLFGFAREDRAILISEKAKLIIEQFNLYEIECFKPAYFIYKNKIYDYYLLTFNCEFIEKILVWEKSEFVLRNYNTKKIRPYDGVQLNFNIFLDEENSVAYNYPDDSIDLKRAAINVALDYYVSNGFNMGGPLVSERLKNALEAARFEGIEFKELDIEFEVVES